jgi:chromosome segregation ATPase
MPYIKIVAYLIGVGIIPLTIQLVTSSMERYKIKSEQIEKAAKQENERLANQKQIQLAILKQVLDISTQANVNDQSHVIRLGLIATIVDDNVEAFGFKMSSALKKLDSLTTLLHPVGILRGKLDDSQREISTISGRIKEHKQKETRLSNELAALDRRLKSNTNRTEAERQRLVSEITLKKEELELVRQEHEQNQKRLNEELSRKSRYASELERVNKDLQVKVEAAKKAREEVEADATRMKKLVAELSSQSKEEKQKLTAALEKLTTANSSANTTIQNLKSALDALTAENGRLKTDLDAARKAASTPPPK